MHPFDFLYVLLSAVGVFKLYCSDEGGNITHSILPLEKLGRGICTQRDDVLSMFFPCLICSLDCYNSTKWHTLCISNYFEYVYDFIFSLANVKFLFGYLLWAIAQYHHRDHEVGKILSNVLLTCGSEPHISFPQAMMFPIYTSLPQYSVNFLFLDQCYAYMSNITCSITQVPSEFKDILDNTVVAALSHSSANVCCKIGFLNFHFVHS